ncbi:MAG: hypothetical protein ORN51_07175 [Akkermansiaceae bacterium]|nr:hypothetical protein [Akkermansiaceae bacterium]
MPKPVPILPPPSEPLEWPQPTDTSTQLNTDTASQESDESDPPIPAWREFAPAGLLVLAFVFFIAALKFQVFLLLIPTAICVGAGVIGLDKIRHPPKKTAPVARSTTPEPDAVRQSQLEAYLSQYLAKTRGRIESVTPFSAVVIHGEKVNHVLHLLISVLLCGLWLPVWFLIAQSGGERRTVISVDECGNVTAR